VAVGIAGGALRAGFHAFALLNFVAEPLFHLERGSARTALFCAPPT
jgi:hypothetical protein